MGGNLNNFASGAITNNQGTLTIAKDFNNQGSTASHGGSITVAQQITNSGSLTGDEGVAISAQTYLVRRKKERKNTSWPI